MYKVIKSVEVELVRTYPTRNDPKAKTETYRGRIGTGVRTSDSYKVFGYVHPHYPEEITHMCYGLEYFEPEVVLNHTKNLADGWFYFDAGSSMPAIKISYDELKRAFIELGLLDA